MAETIKALVERNRDSLSKRLPTYLRPEQFFQLCYSLDRDKKLAAVASRNPDSVLNCVFKAADLGLTIGGPFGHCFMVPYGEVVELIVGWKGFVYQWLIAGAVIKVVSNVVYTGDEIEVIEGDSEAINHKPNLSDPHRADMRWLNDKKNILGSYSIAWLPTGPKMYRWVPLGQIESARNKSSNKDGPAWTHSYPAMAAKTAVRRLEGLIQVCGPTPENREAWERYARTIELDRQQFDVTEDLPDDLPGVPTGSSNPKSGAATEPASTEQPTTPPPRGSEKPPPSAAPPPSSPKKAAEPDPEPEPEDQEPITIDQQDELIRVATMCGMKTSHLKKLVADTFNVLDMPMMTHTQGDKLLADLRKRLGQ